MHTYIHTWPNQLQMMFAKIKYWMRMAEARTVDAINNHTAKLVNDIPPKECANYFRNSGYRST